MHTPNPFVRSLLALPSAGYYAVQKLRETAYKWGLLAGTAAPVHVLSVGNLLLGGSGKTPFVIYLANLLRGKGVRPAVVSRGYRGTNKKEYLIVARGDASPPLSSPSESGDEPFLIASRLPEVPVLVGRKRIHPVRAAHMLFGTDVVILDDGFQHLALQRTADIVLLNGGEDHMFPLGGLREPFSALRRATIIILVGSDAVPPPRAQRYLEGKPIFRCRLQAVSLHGERELPALPPDIFKGKEVFLFSAIAHPERFTATARELGWKVTDHAAYRDHHRFTDSELELVLRRAHGCSVVVTEKDWVKLPEWLRRSGKVSALRITVKLDEEEAFLATVLNLVGRT